MPEDLAFKEEVMMVRKLVLIGGIRAIALMLVP
jgi:hypothetical protein